MVSSMVVQWYPLRKLYGDPRGISMVISLWYFMVFPSGFSMVISYGILNDNSMHGDSLWYCYGDFLRYLMVPV